MTYKLTNGWPLHLETGAFINPESPEYVAFLAGGGLPETADAPPAPSVLDEIRALEAANPITHRHLRDLSMAAAQIAEAITGQPAATLPMVQEIQRLEAEIDALRAQL